MLPLFVVFPAFASTTFESVPDAAAAQLSAAVDACVAKQPWWGNFRLSSFPSGESGEPSISIQGDDALLESDSEHYYAFPSECIEGALKLLPTSPGAVQDWLTEAGFVEVNAVVERDTAAQGRIVITGVGDEIRGRLVDRAQRCGATPGSYWVDVEVMLGRNGFTTPTGVVRGARDGGFLECLAKNYLMDLAEGTKPSFATALVTVKAPDGTEPAAPAPGFKVGSARAYTQGGTALTVELNSTALTCDQLGKARYDVPDGEQKAEVIVQEVWRADGTSQTRVVYGWYKNTTSMGDQGPASLSGSAEKGWTLSLPPGFKVGGDGGISLGNTFQAVHCGDLPRQSVRGDAPDNTPPAAERDLSTLVLTLAGRKVPLAGAILMGKGDSERIELSTEGLSCYSLWSEADLTLSVALPNKGSGQVFLAGTRIPAQATDSYEAKDKAVISLGKAADGQIPLTVQLTMDQSGYPLSLVGKANLLDCRR